MPLDYDQITALIVAIILGGAIGFEREINGKPAGLRTNILICMGAAVFTIVAQHFSSDLEGATRIMAGVVTGVGFLGAGALIQEGKGIHGLTTAASIWLVASVGVTCGAGLYALAVVITALALAVLLGLHPLTRMINKRIQKRQQKAALKED